MKSIFYALLAAIPISLTGANAGWCIDESSCLCTATPVGGLCLRQETDGLCREYPCYGGSKCDCLSGDRLCSLSTCDQGSILRKTEGAKVVNGLVSCQPVLSDVMCAEVISEYPLPVGSPCEEDGPACSPGSECSQDNVCAPKAISDESEPEGPVPVGQACQSGGTPCVSGATCSEEGVCSTSKIELGEACSTSNGSQCVTGAKCSEENETCMIMSPDRVVGRLWSAERGIVAGVSDPNRDILIVPHGPIRASPTTNASGIVDWGALQGGPQGYSTSVRVTTTKSTIDTFDSNALHRGPEEHPPSVRAATTTSANGIFDWSELQGGPKDYATSGVLWAHNATFGYTFTNAPKGKLMVTLGFVEAWVNGAGARVFNIVINGKTKESQFDVFAEGGNRRNVVVTRRYEVEAVSEGDLRVDFTRDETGASRHPTPFVTYIVVHKVLGLGASCSLDWFMKKEICGIGSTCSPASKTCVVSPDKVVGRLWNPDKGIVAGVSDPQRDVTIVPHGTIRVTGTTQASGIVDWGALEGGPQEYVASGALVGTAATIGYTFRTAPKGKLVVNLGFVEAWHTFAGARVFNIVINGETKESEFDVFAEGGNRRNVVVTRKYEVEAMSEGDLRVEFTPIEARPKNPIVQYIVVQRVSELGAACSQHWFSSKDVCGAGSTCSPASKTCVVG